MTSAAHRTSRRASTGASAVAAPTGGDRLARRSMRALGTTALVVVTDPNALDRAATVLGRELDAIDRACSRFRADSELWRLHGAGGHAVEVGPVLFEALSVAVAVAEATDGAVDPTVGRAVEALGYDRDFAAVAPFGRPLDRGPVPAPGWWRVELDPERRRVRIPAGTHVDLGASAKALVSDRAARRIATELGVGVLVGVGGDVAVDGAVPDGGWPIGIAVDSSAPREAVHHVVAITSGGLASSSTVVRSWQRGTRRLHHIVDPRTGDVAPATWTLVSAVGASCVDANAAATAAVVWGTTAPARLAAMGRPARLVAPDGTVTTVAGWPEDRALGGSEAQAS